MRNSHDAISPSDLLDARESDVEPRVEYTHHIAWATVQKAACQRRPNRRRLPAVCGEPIDVSESTRDPDCPTCRAHVEAEAVDESKSVEEQFGVFGESGPPVTRLEFNSTAGYRPKGATR